MDYRKNGYTHEWRARLAPEAAQPMPPRPWRLYYITVQFDLIKDVFLSPGDEIRFCNAPGTHKECMYFILPTEMSQMTGLRFPLRLIKDQLIHATEIVVHGMDKRTNRDTSTADSGDHSCAVARFAPRFSPCFMSPLSSLVRRSQLPAPAQPRRFETTSSRVHGLIHHDGGVRSRDGSIIRACGS